MPLLVIEIDLESFFDINLILFTTFGFVFSVIVTSALVFILSPLSAKAKIVKGLMPEKMNLIYLRLIIYILAELIAFILDIFLVIFAKYYSIPIFTIVVFLVILLYKLIFVIFKSYKDLGFNSKGIIDSVKTVSQIIKDKNLDSMQDLINSEDDEVSNYLNDDK